MWWMKGAFFWNPYWIVTVLINPSWGLNRAGQRPHYGIMATSSLRWEYLPVWWSEDHWAAVPSGPVTVAEGETANWILRVWSGAGKASGAVSEKLSEIVNTRQSSSCSHATDKDTSWYSPPVDLVECKQPDYSLTAEFHLKILNWSVKRTEGEFDF